MSYVVVKGFRDSEDELYTYRLGQTYPREGYEPTEERIQELSGKKNKVGQPVIKVVLKASAPEEPDSGNETSEPKLPVDLSGNVNTVNGLITAELGKETLELLLKAEQNGSNRKGVTNHIESLLKDDDQ